jgi:hypothetical protein
MMIMIMIMIIIKIIIYSHPLSEGDRRRKATENVGHPFLVIKIY